MTLPIDNVYPDARPFTRWWWFSGEMREEDIRSQLDWLKSNNFGGVEIAWVYPQPGSKPGPKWLSPELARMAAYASGYARSIGLGCDFTFGTAWPFGGSFVQERDASKNFKGLSEQRLRISWEEPHAPPGYVIDHLSSEALERYSRRMADFLEKAIKTGPCALFCDSWEVETKGLWTDGFEQSFRDTYGYEITRYMDKLADYPHIRYDYRKLLSEYVLNQFYRPFTSICNRLGAVSRVQCHGAPADILTAYAAAGIPESEAVLFDPHFSLIAASAAALSGKQVVSAETFTCLYGWVPSPKGPPFIKKEQTADLKLLADAMFANGVNFIVWHGMPYNQPGGSNEFYATVHVGPDSAFADELPAFNSYMERACGFMRTGEAYSDVAAYLPLEDNWMKNELPEEKFRPSARYHWELQYQRMPGELAGRQPLWITLPFLRDAQYRGGKLLCGKAAFNSLYIDVDWLDMQALERILELASRGLPVCLKRKPSQPGHVKGPGFEKQLSLLCGLGNVSDNFGPVSGGPPLVEGKDLPEFFCRITNEDALLFFAHPLTKNIQYPMRYGQSYCEEVFEIPVRINVFGDTKEVNLVFAPYQSLLLRIKKDNDVVFENIYFLPKRPLKHEPGKD